MAGKLAAPSDQTARCPQGPYAGSSHGRFDAWTERPAYCSAPRLATRGASREQLHAGTGHTAGNGSLLRTTPVALAYLDDPGGLVEAATAISALPHFDPDAGACGAGGLLGAAYRLGLWLRVRDPPERRPGNCRWSR